MPLKKVKTPVSAPEPEVASPSPDERRHTIIPGNDWEPPKMMIRPTDQISLTEKELGEELTRLWKAENPNAAHNIAHFSHKEKIFKHIATVEQSEFHLKQEGMLLHVAGDEAKKQKERQQEEKNAIVAEEERQQVEGKDVSEDDARGMRNQFNFSERTSQTLNNGHKERGTMTEPPPSVEYAGQATQWDIFDAYMEDHERKREAERKQKKSSKGGEADKKGGEADGGKLTVPTPESTIHGAKMAHASKILERMVNQNTYDDITHDFRFWEDASDLYREGEGTLLPLWKFYNERTKRKHVTSVKWNPEYPDLFAVGYGSFDFMKQGVGFLCMHSLKNPSFPEYSCQTESGVMCLDWHPQHSSVLCVGLYDGTVAVYDTRSKKSAPIFQSTVKKGKHTDPVWEVCWQDEDLAKNLNFFSVSSDGRVTLWTLSKSELDFSDLMQLKLVAAPGATPAAGVTDEEEASLAGLAGGCCFDFSSLSEHLFLVGTEEGRVHKCSKAYNSQYLETYNGHYMAVYTVRWNPFSPRIFISCSADWTVKLWDHMRPAALLSFDLNNQVGDVAWTPWSSTTFAACTADGKVHVFDLNENKNEALCEQKVVRKAKCTKLAFNLLGSACPVILVGDDHSCVSSLKLSPNLRWTAITKAMAEANAKAEAEAAAAGGGPRKGAAPKKVEEVGEAKDPVALEVAKVEKIVDAAIKSQLIEGK